MIFGLSYGTLAFNLAWAVVINLITPPFNAADVLVSFAIMNVITVFMRWILWRKA